MQLSLQFLLFFLLCTSVILHTLAHKINSASSSNTSNICWIWLVAFQTPSFLVTCRKLKKKMEQGKQKYKNVVKTGKWKFHHANYQTLSQSSRKSFHKPQKCHSCYQRTDMRPQKMILHNAEQYLKSTMCFSVSKLKSNSADVIKVHILNFNS